MATARYMPPCIDVATKQKTARKLRIQTAPRKSPPISGALT